MEELSLDDLFFEGPTTAKRFDKQNLQSWLCAPAPSIEDIPHALDLQNEIDFRSAASLQKPPVKRVNALESKSPGPYASQHGIHFNTKVTPNTGNMSSENVTLTYPWFSCGDNEAPGTDFLPPEQNLPQSQETDDSPSMLRRSLFKHTFQEEQLLSDNSFEQQQKKEVPNKPLHPNLPDTSSKAEGLLPWNAEMQFGILRPVSEIPKQFRSIFKEFPYFNYIQSKALDDVLYSDKNFVMCAPTGSGKTVIFEIAIVKLLMEEQAPWTKIKIVYMAPIKALCGQRFDDWKEKFEPIGLNCKELTGDTEMDDLFEIQHANIIMTTPEKWDSMSRKWRDNTLIQLVRLFLIDEVHTVKDESRGATLEVVVSRMKTMQASLLHTVQDARLQPSMRFVAVSATIPNADDIAEWLSDGQHSGICMKMNESHRPVKLRKVVLGYPSGSNQTEYKFDLSLNYKIPSIIQTYSDQKPTLVFCATRKGVQQAASILAKDAKFSMTLEHKQRLQNCATSIKDGKLRELVLYGVGYHHAGMDVSDRKKIEAAFTAGDLPVLFTTSTLAMGVNLPAHLVIIKSTMHYATGMFQEYSETDILQMIGRAGRPQFDSTATAVIMTRFSTKERYEQMLQGVDTIESSLHRHLVEHLNAEIALHTITDGNIALEWIRSTFLYIRTLKNPSHYGFQGVLDKVGIESKLQELCLKNLNDLSSVGLIRIDEDVNFKPTETGKLVAQYYIAFDTAKMFYSVHGKETMAELISMISSCKEFSDIKLRVNEKRALNTLNKDKNRATIRFPLEGKIKSREMKVNCLIQAQLGCLPVQDFSLTQDMARIFRQGTRVTKCLYEFLALQENKFTAFLNALILTKCFRCKLWENSSYVSKQLDKIGVSLANAMVNADLTSFEKIENTNPRELELIVNRHPPFGNQIKEAVSHLAKYKLMIDQLARYSTSVAEIVVTVLLTNFEILQKKRTAPDSHYATIIIGDSDNNVVFRQKITDAALLKSGSWTKKTEVKKSSTSDELSVNLISSEYVGLDIHQKFRAVYSQTQNLGQNGDVEWNHANSCKNTPQLVPGCSSLQTMLKAGMRDCNHHCRNKEACGHDCCKTGVSQKADSKTNSNFSSYLSDLRNRNSVSSAPPVKRLKMQLQADITKNLQKYAFMPKPSMNSGLWPVALTATAQTETQEEPSYENWRNSDQPPDGAGCLYSEKVCADYQKNQAIITDQHSVRSDKPDAVTFDLGDAWDELDDDCLLKASSYLTSVEVPTFGSAESSISYSIGNVAAKYPLSTVQQKENSGIKISKNSNLRTNTANTSLHSGMSKCLPYNAIPESNNSGQYLEKKQHGISTVCSPGDFFIGHTSGNKRNCNLRTNEENTSQVGTSMFTPYGIPETTYNSGKKQQVSTTCDILIGHTSGDKRYSNLRTNTENTSQVGTSKFSPYHQIPETTNNSGQCLEKKQHEISTTCNPYGFLIGHTPDNKSFRSSNLRRNTKNTSHVGMSNILPDNGIPVTANNSGQYQEKEQHEVSTVYNPFDFFIGHRSGNKSQNSDEETQAFIGIFDGIF